MPPKGKTGHKHKDTEGTAKPPPDDLDPPPKTVHERSSRVFAQGHPYAASLASSGPSGLSLAERTIWANAYLARSPADLKRLGTKAQRDVWRHVNESGLPLRALEQASGLRTGKHTYDWDTDKYGADLGEYAPESFAKRSERIVQLSALEVQHTGFLEKKERERGKWVDPETKEPVSVSPNEVEEEKLRRKEIAALRMELYGEHTDPYSKDPAWDDVVPMPMEDGEGALAAIAYPDDYAEAISYLRAVMAKKEYSQRCLRLTEHIIKMNPAHYTVWLYRFSIVSALNIPIPDEIAWLNQVSMDNLKNYQIWHHRKLLMDHYYPAISSFPDKVAELAKSEQEFLARILAEDTKNYHVWSYRQYLVPKLGIFSDAELKATEAFIDDDVRNNSAWSHRFFVVFSDPAHSTPGSHATDADPRVPAGIVDREVKYAQDKILLAPQNQSPWNYLRGALVKGGRKLASAEEFVGQFVAGLDGAEGKETVTSTYGLDMLAEIYAEKGDKERADLCLRRLGDKWDRIRLGYWEWRRRMLRDEAQD